MGGDAGAGGVGVEAGGPVAGGQQQGVGVLWVFAVPQGAQHAALVALPQGEGDHVLQVGFVGGGVAPGLGAGQEGVPGGFFGGAGGAGGLLGGDGLGRMGGDLLGAAAEVEAVGD